MQSVAGAALILYGTFLGTEGDGDRFMLRHGTPLYFGFTCIGMLIVAGRMQRSPRALARTVAGLCAALPLPGLAHVLPPLACLEEHARDAVHNAAEGWGGAIFTLLFFALAAAWRAAGSKRGPAVVDPLRGSLIGAPGRAGYKWRGPAGAGPLNRQRRTRAVQEHSRRHKR